MKSSKITKLGCMVIVLVVSSSICCSLASAQTLLTADCSNASAVATSPTSYESQMTSLSRHVSAVFKVTPGATQAVIEDGGISYLATQQAGEVYYPYIELVATETATLDAITFRHFHTHTDTQDDRYLLGIQLDDNTFFFNNDRAELNSTNSGQQETLNLNLKLSPGKHAIKFIVQDLAGESTFSDYVGIGEITVTGYAPEPATIPLLAAGAALCIRKRRKN